jgi:membrane-associated phospholipid phosphatase
MLEFLTQIELGWGLDLILWFQSWRSPMVEIIFLIITFTGSTDFYLLILPLIYWSLDEKIGRRVGLFLLMSAWANAWFKVAFRRPRPFTVSDRVKPSYIEGGFGLPSGHAQGTTSLWGSIAIEVTRRWVTIVVVIYLLLVGLSRMVVGVHYLQDVLLGWLIGIAFLGVYAWAMPRFAKWLGERLLWQQVGLAVVISALMLVIHPVLIPVETEYEFGLAVTPAAAFLGICIGLALDHHYLNFSAKGTPLQRVLRFLLGLVGALALRLGLGAAFEGLEPPLIFRLIRYGLIGLWVGFGAPWVFVRIRLADAHLDEGTSSPFS